MTSTRSGRILAASATAIALVLFAASASAQTIPYKRNVTLNVGESIVLKGVRGNDCETAPSWGHIAGGMPRSRLGRLSNGGKGFVNSNACGKRVPARAVKFTAQRKGSERIVVYEDSISITVK